MAAIHFDGKMKNIDNLPVETAEFFSAVNLITVKTIGIDILDEILLQANISFAKIVP